MDTLRSRDCKIKCLLLVSLCISPLLTASEELDANNNPPTLDTAKRQRISQKSPISYRSFDRDSKKDFDSSELPHLNLIDELRRKTPPPVTKNKLTTEIQSTTSQTEKSVPNVENVTSNLNHTDDQSLLSFLKGKTPKPPSSDGQRSAKNSKRNRFQESERSAAHISINEKARKFSPIILITTEETVNSSSTEELGSIQNTTIPVIPGLKETSKIDEPANETLTTIEIVVETTTILEQSSIPMTSATQNSVSSITQSLTTSVNNETFNVNTTFITTELDEQTSSTESTTSTSTGHTTLKEKSTPVEPTTLEVVSESSTSKTQSTSGTVRSDEGANSTTESVTEILTTSESFEPIPSADKEVMKREPNQAALTLGLVFLFLAVVIVLVGFLMYRRLKKRNRSDPEGHQRFSRVFRDW